jgi:ribosomal protein S8
MAKKEFPIYIITNGWYRLKSRSRNSANIEFVPSARIRIGLSDHFEIFTYTPAQETNLSNVPTSELNRINTLHDAARVIESQLHDKKPAGFNNKQDAINEMQRLKKNAMRITQKYNTKPTSKITIAIFESSRGTIAFKTNVDTGADIVALAKKGHIIDITHSDNGEIEKISTRQPRIINRLNKPVRVLK